MLHFLSFAGTLPYVAIPLLLYCMCGYFFLNKMLRINLRKTYGFWVSLPIYLGGGMVIYTFILYVIGLIVFNGAVAVSLAVLIPLLFFGDLLLSTGRSPTSIMKILGKAREYAPPRLRKLASEWTRLIPVLVFTISLLFITNIVTIFEWPPPGDIITHGFYVSLIIYDQKIPASLYPFFDAATRYPLGFHASAAFLDLLLGIYPGEAVLLIGGIMMVVLTSLMFTVTYIVTGSNVLSFSVYVLSFLGYSTQAGGNLEEWLFGYLFNGPYPNIYGFLIVLMCLTIIIVYAKTKDEHLLTILYPITMIVLLVTYPNFIVVPLLFFVFAIFQLGAKSVVKTFFKTRKSFLFTALLIALSAFLIILVYFRTVVNMLSALFSTTGYNLPPSYLLGSVFGVSIVSAFVFSSILVTLGFWNVRRPSSTLSKSIDLVELRPILLTYDLITIVLFASLNPAFFFITQFMLPMRLAILTMLISLVLNVYALSLIVDVLVENVVRFLFVDKRFSLFQSHRLQKSSAAIRIRESGSAKGICKSVTRMHGSARRKLMPATKAISVVFLMFIFFNANGLLSYSLLSQSSFELATYSSYNSHTPYFQGDFAAMEWLYTNARHGELILNDFSWDGLYITSLGALNVTMQYSYLGLNRTKDLQLVWELPMYPSIVQSLLKEYNVSYIFSTGDPSYYDILGGQGYVPKPYSPLVYIELFSNYTFLQLVFRSGNSSVFEVK